MQYYLCPRCQFRVSASKKVCNTCGFDISTLNSTRADKIADKPSTKDSKFALLSKLFGSAGAQKESGKEKPALG